MNPDRPQPKDTLRPDDSYAVMLVVPGDLHPLYRRLGPLAWTALTHLALNAARTDDGWSAPVGVRDVAAGIGVTKDTAARAVRSLAAAGLVSRDRIATAGGPLRSGYRLNLPDTIRLVPSPPTTDDQPCQPAGRSELEDTPTTPKVTPLAAQTDPPPRREPAGRPPQPNIPPVSWDQPDLFATAPISTAETSTAGAGRRR